MRDEWLEIDIPRTHESNYHQHQKIGGKKGEYMYERTE